MTPPRTLAEVLVLLDRPGEHLVTNPFTQTWAKSDTAFVELLSFLRDARDDAVVEAAFGETAFRAIDARVSRFEDGLLGDPTGLDREATIDGAPELSLADALKLARKLQLAVDDEAAYAANLVPRQNVLDRNRRGNVHQLVGEHVLLEKRLKSVDDWWVDQKFTPDRRGPRPGPYLDVQWRFMTSYYDRERLEGKRVLDFGCGPGLFTRLFASLGAEVLGIDTNAEHLEVARRLAEEDGLGDRVRLEELALPAEDSIAAMDEAPFDLIFLSDVLMFYFHSYDTRVSLDPSALLQALADRLAPGGRITVLEPEATFWQHPWLGEEDRPFTLLTEYRTRNYGVAPTLEQMSRAAESAGLAIARVRELVPGEDASGRANGYAREFPLWWCFELVKAPAAGA